MRKLITALLASIALLLGGLVAASGASAAANTLRNNASSTCRIEYRSTTTGTTWTIAPGGSSTRAVAVFRIPAGCHGTANAPGYAGFPMTPGSFYLFSSYTHGQGVSVVSHVG